MLKTFFLPLVVFILLGTSCAVSNKNYNPAKKYSRLQLQKDYLLLRQILETKHPALNWYTPKDSMDFYFDSLYNAIADSMTEQQFGWHILAPLTQKIHCGHTSFSMSSQWFKFARDRVIPSFPFYVKVWGDTMIVTGDLNRKDSIIKKGTLITSINGISNHDVVQKIFQYLPLDGYADNVNYIRLSGNFPYFHRNVYGLFKNYRIGYLDSLGSEKTMLVPLYTPPVDTLHKKGKPPYHIVKIPRKIIRKERRESYRSILVDTANSMATITLNTFSNGGGRHLRRFIKSVFRTIHQQQIKNCILDLRSNGGGDVSLSVLLTKYLRNTRFKVADTAYASGKSFSPYTRYISKGFLNNLGLLFVTKKKKDGFYHFGYWERHWFYPKKNNHFNGQLYVLTNGPTFSASTLFCNAVKGQQNVTLAGEETGGGWYGNSGLLIPDITLPITKLKVRLPFFKIVQFNHVAKNGRGVAPDIFIPPTTEAVKNNIDRKMEIVKGLIREANQQK